MSAFKLEDRHGISRIGAGPQIGLIQFTLIAEPVLTLGVSHRVILMR